MDIIRECLESEESDDVIYKWRVKAMLNNIKYMVKNDNTQIGIINVINSYLKFVDEVAR